MARFASPDLVENRSSAQRSVDGGGGAERPAAIGTRQPDPSSTSSGDVDPAPSGRGMEAAALGAVGGGDQRMGMEETARRLDSRPPALWRTDPCPPTLWRMDPVPGGMEAAPIGGGMEAVALGGWSRHPTVGGWRWPSVVGDGGRGARWSGVEEEAAIGRWWWRGRRGRELERKKEERVERIRMRVSGGRGQYLNSIQTGFKLVSKIVNVNT